MSKEELLQTYFYIEDISGSTNTVSITKNNASAPTLNLEYSTDGSTWTTKTMNEDTTANTFTLPANGKLYLRGVNDGWCSSSSSIFNSYYNSITATGSHNVGGNIMSLLYGSEFEGKTTFPTSNSFVLSVLFRENKTLVNAKDLILPATTLANSCYYGMFQGCSKLTTAPELPATELASNCYHHMFTGCKSLKSIPELPANDLTNKCYHGMFMNCDGIDKVSLPEAYLAPYAYSNMFLGSDNLSDVTVTYNENVDETNYIGWLDDVSINGVFKYNHTEEVEEKLIRSSYYVPITWGVTKTE